MCVCVFVYYFSPLLLASPSPTSNAPFSHLIIALPCRPCPRQPIRARGIASRRTASIESADVIPPTPPPLLAVPLAVLR